jgi:hypothetical protein
VRVVARADDQSFGPRSGDHLLEIGEGRRIGADRDARALEAHRVLVSKPNELD